MNSDPVPLTPEWRQALKEQMRRGCHDLEDRVYRQAACVLLGLALFAALGAIAVLQPTSFWRFAIGGLLVNYAVNLVGSALKLLDVQHRIRMFVDRRIKE